ncbi:MAG: TldD/PmbA family protein [Halobacteriota archaeon]
MNCEFYDIRRIESSNLSITLENGNIERPKYDSAVAKGFRALNNGFWGLFSGGVPDDEGLKKAEDSAVISGNSSVVPAGKGGNYTFKVKQDPADVSIEEKVDFLREAEKELKADHIVNTRVGYLENTRKFHYRDSSGTEVTYEVPRSGITIQAVAKDTTLQFLAKRKLKPGGYEVAGDDVLEMASDIRDTLKELLKASQPPSGEMNVLMDQSLGGVFIHEAFGHAVEGDHVLQGATVLADRLGEKVAVDNVNVYDDPTIHEFGFFPFDDEGVESNRKAVIEDGVLKNYLHNRETASKLGGKAGNGRSQGVAEPIVRMSNTYLDEGDLSFEELLKEAKDGVYLVGSRGGETNPATGYFHFSAQYGYLIRNGELSDMVRDVSLSGNTLEVLHSIKLGDGLRFDPGFCGKGGQLVPIADAAPYSLVKAVVGGS